MIKNTLTRLSLATGLLFSFATKIHAQTPMFLAPDPTVAAQSKPYLFGDTTGTNTGGAIALLIQFIFVLAVILALGFLVWGGIKWLTSGGDKENVAGARNTIVAAIIGLIIIFISYVILNFVVIFLTGEGIGSINVTPLT